METTAPRLKTALWVQAQLRFCDRDCIPLTVLNKGDGDAGAVLLKIVTSRESCRVYSRAFALDGERGWLCATGIEPVDEGAADAYILKQRSFDRDLWVLEVDDPKGLYQLDAPLIE